jgi:deoxyribonuclease-4
MKKILVGAHTSASGGTPQALIHGQEIGATTVQLFTSNQKQWKGREISDEEAAEFKKKLDETHINSVMSHDSYLINLGSPDQEIHAKSVAAFRSEINRCHRLSIPLLNFHPGTATQGTEEQCLTLIANTLLSFQDLLEKGGTRLLLETTAGQGRQVGYRFSHLDFILSLVHKKIPIGVTIDTCHIFAAGYDLSTPSACQETLDTFDREVGLSHLYAFHFNDSQKPLGSRVDRHASLGDGQIGWAPFQFFMTHPKTKFLPKYLETPDPELWPQEIKRLKNYAHEN